MQSTSKPEYFKIKDGKLKEEFEKLSKSTKSILKTSTKYVAFHGLLDGNDRSCVHMELKNPTENTVIFNIRAPFARCFFVKPRVGKINPNGSATLYFTFKARVNRVPDDYCWIYSIYQLIVPATQVSWMSEDEFTTRRVRSLWKSHGNKDVENILHLSVIFDTESSQNKECVRHFPNQVIIVNDAGEVMAEEPPDEDKDNDTDDLPPTAEGQ